MDSLRLGQTSNPINKPDGATTPHRHHTFGARATASSPHHQGNSPTPTRYRTAVQTLSR
ncbi:MAG: hypothetical protein AB4042_01930 [Leptolyngbyaceae cyanobacterium]